MQRLAILLLLSFSSISFGQSGCTVEEEQKLSSVTGRFLFGPSTMTLTLPHVLFRSDLAVVYMQVFGGDVPKGARLDSGGETVEIKDGAALHLFPKRNKRLAFAVIDAGGQHLCDWVTRVGTSKYDPPVIREGFDPFSVTRQMRLFQWQRFYNAGDPIFLRVGGKLASEAAEFSIDGLSMTVLARNACQLILLDPHPVAGMRTIESRGFSITLPFIVLQLKLSAVPPRPGPAVLEINVLGRDQLGLPAMPVSLALYNSDPGRVQLLCGKTFEPTVSIHLENKNGKLTGTCRVKLLKDGPASFDGLVSESGRASHRAP